MAYDSASVYAKYLKKKITESGCSGCSNGCSEGCTEEKECSCCPTGLVAVYDQNGKHQGCLTPNDAQEWHDNTFQCQEGYVKLYKEGETPLFRGCVSESEYAALYEALNP